MSKNAKVEESRKPVEIHGGKICLFGDLHLSYSYEGQHISYLKECYMNMELIKEICNEEKPTAIVFEGDIVGVNERNLKDRQFLMRVIQFFAYLNGITNNNVYSVKGNHDMGDFTDFDFLIGMGLIKNPKYIDYYGDNGNHEVRFHLVNYGYEKASLPVTDPADAVSNVVIGHADYFIDGVTNWYSAKQGVELSKLDNFCGVDLVVSGHIHIPSEEILYTTLKNGNPIGLFYTGSPSRTAERFDDCWYVVFEYIARGNESSTECLPKFMGLPKASEVFYPKENFELGSEEEDELAVEKEKSEKLTALVKEIIEGRITSGDIVSQIMAVPSVDDETKNLAVKYYQKAERGE